jgi:DNA-binding NarL/FixJ family response regulator
VVSYRILIVDDFASFRHFISSTLQQRPELQIIGEASDGLEALEKAKELQPDLILLDLGMPKLNGLETAKRLPLFAPNAKILFVSQETSLDIVQEALRSRGRGYVSKVRAARDLLRAIDAVLRGEQFISGDLEISGGTDVRTPLSHEILFCSNETTLLESLTRFIASALGAGNPAIVWATELHRHNLLQRLGAEGVDTGTAIKQGIYIAADAAETADPERILVVLRGLCEAASRLGKNRPRVAVCGERSGLLWAEGKTDAALQLEQLLNELAKRNDMDIFCVYPVPPGHEGDPAFEKLCAQHSAAYSH